MTQGSRDGFRQAVRDTGIFPLGKYPSCDLREISGACVSLVICSTSWLFAAQYAIEKAMKSIRQDQGHLPENGKGRINVGGYTALLKENLSRRIP
jgi:hypothetical protein